MRLALSMLCHWEQKRARCIYKNPARLSNAESLIADRARKRVVQNQIRVRKKRQYNNNNYKEAWQPVRKTRSVSVW